MSNKMLIDAAHPEETRVVVVRGRRVEDFDFEAASRKPLRGNIYLAKVTRVEPSLQAAFVDYGGNRHGFLAFSEIHPDYYQIPYADRQALLEEEAREAAENGEDGDEDGGRRRARSSARNGADAAEENGEGEDIVEQAGADDALDEVRARRKKPARRNYKIQEVIKRRQILLVQVVKEERGTKGAALTTYLSLAGRYCVLMPNTSRGGGISRKITDGTDRKRLKEIVGDLQVPEGMGVILRTAGASRTRVEIKRDFEYLLRMWESVRELTLASIAPKLVYEEGSLTKRAIRDLYNKDIDEILVAGEAGYREAKDFMRMLMPSHAKNVKQYKETTPIFTNFGVERQLDAMFSPDVTLPSGGYVVINPTEALVSIDVNSGKATKEHSIEETALQTNLEAAEEIARQLRLRDLAGLIVVDFIDMDEKRNNRAVEKKLKDCLKFDRARIQVGRISAFGLLEMSRQRMRTGVVESSTVPCKHCHATGYVRSVQSIALHVLRTLEDHLLRDHDHHVTVKTAADVALYILNQKRHHLNDLEERFRLQVTIEADETLGTQYVTVQAGEKVEREDGDQPASAISMQTASVVDEAAAEAADEAAARAETEGREEADGADRGEGGSSKKRRRRRRKKPSDAPAGEERAPASASDAAETQAVDAGAPAAGAAAGEVAETGGASEATGAVDAGENAPEAAEASEAPNAEPAADEEDDDAAAKSRRRRGRRGGRRHRREKEGEELGEAAEGSGAASATATELVAEEPVAGEPVAEEPGADETSGPDEAGAVRVIAIREGESEPAPAAEAQPPAVPAAEAPATAEAAAPPAPADEPPPHAAPAADEGASGEPEAPAPASNGHDAARHAAAETASEAPEAATAEAEPATAAAGTDAPEADQAAASGLHGPVGETAQEEDRSRRSRPRRAGWWQRRSFF